MISVQIYIDSALETEWTLDWEKNPKALFFSLVHNLWKSDKRKQARRNTIAPCSNFDDKAETVLHSEERINYTSPSNHSNSPGKISSTVDTILPF